MLEKSILDELSMGRIFKYDGCLRYNRGHAQELLSRRILDD